VRRLTKSFAPSRFLPPDCAVMAICSRSVVTDADILPAPGINATYREAKRLLLLRR